MLFQTNKQKLNWYSEALPRNLGCEINKISVEWYKKSFVAATFFQGQGEIFLKTVIKTMNDSKNNVGYESLRSNPSQHAFISKLTFFKVGEGVALNF